jgi:UDP-3-O-[3-hydroxymyristoyl] glucosamine N-acyltransferase
MVTDQRFFRRNGPYPLGEIAKRLGAGLSAGASAELMIEDIAALDAAVPGEISLFSDVKLLESCRKSRASAIITSRKLAEVVATETPLLLVDDARYAFALVGHLFHPDPPLEPGVHKAASIDPSAEIGEGSQIDAGAVISAGAKLGARCHIGPNAVIARGVVLGDDCHIGSNSSISHAVIGARVRIASNVVIGGPGFGFVASPKGALRLAQIGRVIVGDGVEMGSNCTIDRGAMGDTIIGNGTMFDNAVHIAHNVQIGRFCMIAGQIGIAGSAVIGDFVVMGGQVGVSDHIHVGRAARLAAKSGVIKDVAAGESVGGYPAVPLRQWHRQTILLRKLLGKKEV